MKAYVKPQLFVESYELSQHIATCGMDIQYADTETCTAQLDPDYWDGSADIVFNGGRTECKDDIGIFDAYCYTTGTDVANKLFNS